MKVYNNLLQDFQSSYMMMIPLTIIFQSCLGSIATLYILMNKGPMMLLQLGICIAVTMMYNASVLAQLNKKVVFNLLILSVLSNVLLWVTA
jgi:hypothetical protein